MINIDADIRNADWPKRTDDRLASLRIAAFNPDQPRDVEAEQFRAVTRRETDLHAAADRHVPQFSVALRYAFAEGRRVARRAQDADRIASAVKAALRRVAEPLLLKVLIAGGEVGMAGIAGLRAAEFDPDQPRDEQGQWTDGGVTTRPDGAPIVKSPERGSIAERRGIKIGSHVFYHYRAPGEDKGRNGSGRVVGFVSNRGRDKGSIQDVAIRDGDSVKFVAEKNVRPRRMHTLADKPRFRPIRYRFNSASKHVLRWASEHAAELVTQVSDTTRERVREAISKKLETGTDAVDEILAAVGDEQRAELIARHEPMLAASEGQRQAWDQAVEGGLLTGGERRTWITTPDAKLCPQCEALEGQTAPLGGEYEGGVAGPPAHVACRCTEGLV